MVFGEVGIYYLGLPSSSGKLRVHERDVRNWGWHAFESVYQEFDEDGDEVTWAYEGDRVDRVVDVVVEDVEGVEGGENQVPYTNH